MTDREAFRHVIGHFASGVTVITTRHDGADFGATASAVTSLSLDPPMLLICMNRQGSTQRGVTASGVFGLNILDEDQAHLADRFARPAAGERFAGVHVDRGRSGVPILAGTLASCECTVDQYVDAGTHRVFLARVTDAVARDGLPLTYFRGNFGRFETDDDDWVYHEIRRRILHRAISLDDPVDPERLAVELSSSPRIVYHAITKLVADGLLLHDPARGYAVRPITLDSAEKEYDARCAMELGAVALTVGRVPRERLSRLRAAMDRTTTLLADGRIADITVYARQNHEFHSAIVDLAENPSLAHAYRRLGFAALTLTLLTEGSEIGSDIADDHRAIVQAYERADMPRAMGLVIAHNEHVKQTIRRALLANGGRV